MEFVDETLASRRIKAARLIKGFTQAEMADRLKVTRAVYIKYENKPYTIPIKKLQPIADLLGCQIGDFFVAL